MHTYQPSTPLLVLMRMLAVSIRKWTPTEAAANPFPRNGGGLTLHIHYIHRVRMVSEQLVWFVDLMITISAEHFISQSSWRVDYKGTIELARYDGIERGRWRTDEEKGFGRWLAWFRDSFACINNFRLAKFDALSGMELNWKSTGSNLWGLRKGFEL